MVHHFYRTFEWAMSIPSDAQNKPALLIDKYHAPSPEALIAKLKTLDTDTPDTSSVLDKYDGAVLGDVSDPDAYHFHRERYKRRGSVCVGAWAERVYSGAITLNDIYRNYDVSTPGLYEAWEASKYLDINPIGYMLLGIPTEEWKFWAYRPEVSLHPYYIYRYNSTLNEYGMDRFGLAEYENLYIAAADMGKVIMSNGYTEYMYGNTESRGKIPLTLMRTYAQRAASIWDKKGIHRHDIKDFAHMICDDWSVDAIIRFHEINANHSDVQRLYNSGIKDSRLISDVIAGIIPEEWARAGAQA